MSKDDSPNVPTLPKSGEQSNGLSDDEKRAIAQYVEQQAMLYRFCFGQATQQLSGLTSDPEAVRCCASSLFITAQRKFDL